MKVAYWLCVAFGWFLLVGIFNDLVWAWLILLPYSVVMFLWTVAREGHFEQNGRRVK